MEASSATSVMAARRAALRNSRGRQHSKLAPGATAPGRLTSGHATAQLASGRTAGRLAARWRAQDEPIPDPSPPFDRRHRLNTHSFYWCPRRPSGTMGEGPFPTRAHHDVR
eukprot:3293587-Alexandrium_andersonii.AAC.1